ncbi:MULTISPECIES: LptA/OstA family protein [unclassified Bosea (in: a-proteobacteria)]|uniref:LptA/OstA family protein n=1 Tax=unclassified Bosea (in: a-proteobacteria) TaxID=2653178 RepID=UPI00125EDAE6|nr:MULTISPECIES: LptA/OstA family protein [unclassified Bosea (in: a-proteobacteria)]VXB12520.1 Lipopolysaccharide export system protein LptA [Bosea sp. 125]
MKALALALAVLVAPALSTAAFAQQPATKPAKSRGGAPGSPFGGMGGDSKEPIKIDANKLDVLDKDNKAVFSGNVVAVQGETTVRCSVMTVFYEGRGQGGTPKPAQPAAQGQGANDGAIKRIECTGPVTVVSKTQAATSDNAVFDRANNQVIMTGNVALNDGPNITRGDKLVYNTQTGIANVTSSGRVQGFFVPNSGDNKDGKDSKAGAKPAASPTN